MKSSIGPAHHVRGGRREQRVRGTGVKCARGFQFGRSQKDVFDSARERFGMGLRKRRTIFKMRQREEAGKTGSSSWVGVGRYLLLQMKCKARPALQLWGSVARAPNGASLCGGCAQQRDGSPVCLEFLRTKLRTPLPIIVLPLYIPVKAH